MNKQALAFLTMFSLVLMLSVYYVTLPEDNAKTVMSTQEEKGNQKKSEQQTTSEKKEKKNTSNVKVDQLQNEIDQKKENNINTDNETIANAEASEDDKQAALNDIDKQKEQKKLQKSVADALKKEGYTCAVEINDTTAIVSVFDQADDKEIAKKILLKTTEITNNKYLIEVTFK